MEQTSTNETNEISRATAAPEQEPELKTEQKSGLTVSRNEALIFLMAGMLVSFLYTVCFSGREILPQLSFTLFCPAAFAVLTFILKYLGLLKNDRAVLWAVPIAVVAAFNGVFNVNPFTYGNVLVMHALFAVFAISAMRVQPVDLFTLTGLSMILRTIAGNWMVFIGVWQALTIKGRRSGGSSTVQKVLLGALIAFPVLAMIISLLISADMVFGKLVNDFFNAMFNFNFINMLSVLSFVVVSIYAIGYVYQCGKVVRSDNHIAFPRIQADVVISATFLMLLNLVFLLFSVIQAAYLFRGGFMTLPEGMVYSKYAREGFFQLLFVTVINFSVILIFMSVLEGVKKSRLLRLLLLMLCCFTGVLIASSFYRMFLYVDVYGHTVLRLWVITFLVMEVFLICITVAKLFVDTVPFIKWFAITGFLFYLAVNFTGSEYFATKLNVSMFLSGELDYVDIRSVGKDGLHLIKPLVESDQYICADYKIVRKSEAYTHQGESIQTYEDIIGLRRSVERRWQNWSYLKNK